MNIPAFLEYCADFRKKYHNRLISFTYEDEKLEGVLLTESEDPSPKEYTFLVPDDFSTYRVAYNDNDEVGMQNSSRLLSIYGIKDVKLLPETLHDRFKRFVDPRPTDTMQQIRYRVENRYWIREVQRFALRVIDRMHVLEWDKERLAFETELEPSIIQEILSGKRNLFISELMRISNVLDLKITFEIQ